MKRLITILLTFLLAGVSKTFANECKITYAADDGLMLNIMDFTFNLVDNGSNVEEGTTLMVILSCKNGYNLTSFKINGEDHMARLGDDEGIGRDFQYIYKVTGDTHIEATSEVKTFPVLTSVTGDGTLELYDGDNMIESGTLVKYGSDIKVKAVPGAGNSLIEFMANDEDKLSELLKNKNELTLTLYDKTTFKAMFTGNGSTENECAVSWSVSGGGKLEVNCGGTRLNPGDKVVKGDYIDIKAVADKGYSLKSLTVNGEERPEATEGRLTVQVNGPTTLNAVFEADAPDVMWNQMAADAFAGGDGTEQSPYQVATAEQLAKIANDIHTGATTYKGAYFELTADIDLAGYPWLPIGYNIQGSEERRFDGYVDGNGHKITNLTVEPNENMTSTGLFGVTGENFTLRNLTVESGTVSGMALVGALVGYNRGLIENCTNKARVECVMYYCGGIVGYNSKTAGMTAIVRRCVNQGTILAGSGGTNGLAGGGIAGANSSVIEECANYGKVEAPTSNAGGIVASVDGGVIRHCFNRGTIKSGLQVGGICGSATGRDSDCQIYNCYSASELVSYEPNECGGVLGYAMFFEPNKLDVADSYFDKSLFDGPGACNTEDVFKTFTINNVTGLATYDMKSADFVARLNSETKAGVKWVADTQSENDGYPVLAPIGNPSAISTVGADALTVYAEGGRIFAPGAAPEATADVYQTSGANVFSGIIADLQSRTFAKGLYVVKIHGQAYKIIIK